MVGGGRLAPVRRRRRLRRRSRKAARAREGVGGRRSAPTRKYRFLLFFRRSPLRRHVMEVVSWMVAAVVAFLAAKMLFGCFGQNRDEVGRRRLLPLLLFTLSLFRSARWRPARQVSTTMPLAFLARAIPFSFSK